MESLISTNELADKLGVHRITVTRMANDGRIPFVRIGPTEHRFNYGEVLDALKGDQENSEDK